jgi:hypothetical protein
MALSGAISKIAGLARSLSGALTFAGSIARAIVSARTYTGALTFAGEVLADYSTRTYTGALTFASAIARYLVAARTKAGTLTFSGAYSYIVGRLTYTAEGALTFAGDILKIIGYIYTATGAQTFVGAISRWLQLWRTKKGNLNLSGIVSWISIEPLFYGVRQPFSIDLSPFWDTKVYGPLTFKGAVSRILNIFRTPIAALTFAGDVSADYSTRTYSGTLSFSGDISYA